MDKTKMDGKNLIQKEIEIYEGFINEKLNPLLDAYWGENPAPEPTDPRLDSIHVRPDDDVSPMLVFTNPYPAK